jgi:predicted ribosomally synthesized peptide with SipW-like signal peptide
MNRKKILLTIIALVCVLSICIGGTLMLFTDTTDVATNVVTLADRPLRIKLQETGWADRDHNKVSDIYEDSKFTAKDMDNDNYWEYTIPAKNEGHPSVNDGNNYMGFFDIYTGEDESFTNAKGQPVAPFYGIEYPDTLIPNEIVDKAPRVVHELGVDSWLRVLAKTVIYQYDGTKWNRYYDPTSLLDTSFETIVGPSSYSIKDFQYIRYNDAGQMIKADGTSTTIADATVTWRTLGEVVKAFNVNTNNYNWEFVPNSNTEGYYYFIQPRDTTDTNLYYPGQDRLNNPLVFNQADMITHLGLTYASDSSWPENPGRLATFSGDNWATAPLFTQVKIPNITTAMQEILKNYKFAFQFEAQAVQKEGNGPPTGEQINGSWDAYFFELDNAITFDPPIGDENSPAGSYPEP